MISQQEFCIEKIKDGDHEEFERVFFEFFDLLYYLCLQYVQNEKVSEEFVQDAFLKLWEIRKDIDSETNIRNLLYTITKNNCLNYLRNQKTALSYAGNLRYLEMQFNYEALNRLGNEVLEFEELKQLIINAIDKLPDTSKEVFLMSRMEEMKYKEIADQLGVSVKTVEVRMSKALHLLRIELKDYLHLLFLLVSGFN